VPSFLHYFYSTPRVPIGRDEFYCILIGILYAVYANPGVPSVLHYHYSTSRVPIGQDKIYCILIGSGMRFTTTLACMMDLHFTIRLLVFLLVRTGFTVF
jgi:hypothetical protein